MSYQWDPTQCGPAQQNDDFHQQKIEQEVEQVGAVIPQTLGWLSGVFGTFFPIILAVAIVYFVVKEITFSTVALIGLLAVFFYLFQSNMNGSNLAGSLPPATYPTPPHLGLDGVSQRNQTCYNC